MKIYNPRGSKERLIEMMTGVNKDIIFEDLRLEQSSPETSIVSTVIEQIKADIIKITNSDSMKKGDGNTYLDLTGKDDSGNVVKINLIVPTQAGEIDDVFAINDVILNQFEYRKADGSETISLDANDLNDENNNYKSDLIDIATKYVQIESNVDGAEEVTDEIYEDAVKWIDTVPYKGGSERMQTQKAYGDEKPTNPKLRVDAPELDSFINEDEIVPKREAILTAFYALMREKEGMKPTIEEVRVRAQDIQRDIQLSTTRVNEVDKTYPDPIGSEFSPKKNYPKPKKKINKKVKIGESTDTDHYENIVFLQGEEADEALDILKNQGKDAALEYLKQWHDFGNHMGSAEAGAGSKDQTYEKDGYIMSWNFGLGYIGLEYDLSHVNEGDDTEVDNDIEVDVETGIEPNAPDVVNLDADVETLAKGKEETGDEIEGGLADGKSPLDFDPIQIAKGITVEMEHTNNPLIAVEIVMDHLVEDPEYYGGGDEDPEAMAQQGAEADAEKDADDEVADELLGFSPHNVGDVPETPEDEEDKEETNMLLGFKPQNVGDVVVDEGKDDFPIGANVRISDGSGVNSNKTGIIVSSNEIKTNGRGVPVNVMGAYKPVDWSREVAIQLDDGELITMFKNRVHLLNNIGEEIKIVGDSEDDEQNNGNEINTGDEFIVTDSEEGDISLQKH